MEAYNLILRIGLLTAFAAAGIYFFVAEGISFGDSARYNFPWAVQYLDAFNLGAYLPRHLPGLWDGLGGFDFFFYAPIPFWFVTAFLSPICAGCSPETELSLAPQFFGYSVAGWTVLGGLLSCFHSLPAVDLLDTVSSSAVYNDFTQVERWLYGSHFDRPNPVILISFLAVIPFIIASAVLNCGAVLMWVLVPVH